MPAAHDIYAEQLRELRRGHPLHHPEPRPEGPVEIGDVGYTKDGAFRRLFNASRPANDPIQRFGVPDDFVQLDMGVIDTFDAVLEPGPLHSRTISTLSTEVGTPGDILPAEASFRFSCSSKRGAILMLETQMIREEAIQYRRLETYLAQHCRSWHAFARSLDIYISFGDLMLVTECSKTAAWSSAVYSNCSTEFALSFSVGMPFTTAGVTASSILEKIGPVEHRRSQRRARIDDPPLPKDHTVFIKAYRLGTREVYRQSAVSFFMNVLKPSPTRGDREGLSGGGSRSTLTASQKSTSPPNAAGLFIMRPYEPDFHASIALLALEMEKNNDSECVVLHDDIWCSVGPDSNESQIMKQYADFYFSDHYENILNSMSGYDTAIQSPLAEALPIADQPAEEQRNWATDATVEATEASQNAVVVEQARYRAELETAEEEKMKTEERWRKGIPPEFTPTREDVDEMRAQYGYINGLRHFAVVGRTGTGKSSLINALRGMTNRDPGAAQVGVNETTSNVTRYADPNNPKRVWYDVPGAGTLSISDWQYFRDQGLYMFDAVIILYADRFTTTDIALLRTCHNCNIPTFIVRSKSDQYIRNIRRDSGYETDPDDSHSRFDPAFVRAEEKARDKFIKETAFDVKRNLEAAGLRPQRVYLVSRSVLMRVVEGKATSSAIDEHDFHRDIVDIVRKG